MNASITQPILGTYGLNKEHTATCTICRAVALNLSGDAKLAKAELEERGWTLDRVAQGDGPKRSLWYCATHSHLRPNRKRNERQRERRPGL